jgi:CBS domain-containing protein
MRLNDMVSGWMSEHPVTLAPSRPIIEAYALMAEYGIGHLPVLAEGRLVGIVSDRDLHRAARLRDARKPADVSHLFATPVAEIMTRAPFATVEPLATIREAAAKLLAFDVHSLPVVEEGDRLVGLLTSSDLLRALVGTSR